MHTHTHTYAHTHARTHAQVEHLLLVCLKQARLQLLLLCRTPRFLFSRRRCREPGLFRRGLEGRFQVLERKSRENTLFALAKANMWMQKR